MNSVLLRFVHALDFVAGQLDEQIYQSARGNAVRFVGTDVLAAGKLWVFILSLCYQQISVQRLDNVLIGTR